MVFLQIRPTLIGPHLQSLVALQFNTPVKDQNSVDHQIYFTLIKVTVMNMNRGIWSKFYL